MRLEDLIPGAQVTGLIGREAVRIVSAQMEGDACDLVFRDGQGNLQSQILFRDKEADLDLVAGGRKWSFQGAGDKLRLVSEGDRTPQRLSVTDQGVDHLSHTRLRCDPLLQQGFEAFHIQLAQQPAKGRVRR